MLEILGWVLIALIALPCCMVWAVFIWVTLGVFWDWWFGMVQSDDDDRSDDDDQDQSDDDDQSDRW